MFHVEFYLDARADGNGTDLEVAVRNPEGEVLARDTSFGVTSDVLVAISSLTSAVLDRLGASVSAEAVSASLPVFHGISGSFWLS